MTLSGRRVLIVGTGLIGTSVGLAASGAGADVQLSDPNPAHLRTAAELGAGRPADDTEPELCIVATSPAATPGACLGLLRRYVNSIVTDVSGAKTYVEVEVRTSDSDLAARYVGGHPLAGREKSGPAAARADIFQGAAWVLTGPPGHARDAVSELVRACGATPAYMSSEDHDRVVAAISHLPQVVASALAASLADLPADAAELAGPGFRDMTRIADSDPELWAQLASANAAHLGQAVGRLAEQLDRLGTALQQGSSEPVHELIARGRQARATLPGKHGGSARPYQTVTVLIPDSPGQLGRLFNAVGDAGVNVEDVRVDHAPGLPIGLIGLAVDPASAPELRATLTRHGWTVID